MGWSEETPNESLPLFGDSDKPSWRGDFNYAMSNIDTAFGRVDSDIAERVAKTDFADIAGISVKDYGAIGDGVADDTLAIQSALDAAESGPGVAVVPSGDYLFSAELVIPGGVTLVGPPTPPSDTSYGARLIYTGSTGVGVSAGGARWGMANISLLYNNPLFDGTLLSCSGGRGAELTRAFAQFDNVWFGADPIYQDVYPATMLVDLQAAQNVVFNSCMFYGAKTLVRGVDDTDTDPWSKIAAFHACTFNRYNNEAVLNAGESWLFNNCVFEPTQDKHGRALRQTVPGVGVTFIAPWLGDNTEDDVWFDWQGRGLSIISGRTYVLGSLVRLSGAAADVSIIATNAITAKSSDAIVDVTSAPADVAVTILSTNPGGNGRVYKNDVKPRRRLAQADYNNARLDVGEITVTNGSASSPGVSFSNVKDGIWYDEVNRRIGIVIDGLNAILADDATTRIQNEFRHSGNTLGFYGVAPTTRPTLPDSGTVTAADIRNVLFALGLATNE